MPTKGRCREKNYRHIILSRFWVFYLSTKFVDRLNDVQDNKKLEHNERWKSNFWKWRSWKEKQTCEEDGNYKIIARLQCRSKSKDFFAAASLSLCLPSDTLSIRLDAILDPPECTQHVVWKTFDNAFKFSVTHTLKFIIYRLCMWRTLQTTLGNLVPISAVKMAVTWRHCPFSPRLRADHRESNPACVPKAPPKPSITRAQGSAS